MGQNAPRRRSDLVVADLNGGEETALMDPVTNQVVSLNTTAAAVWYLCDGTRDAAAIAGEVLDLFPGLDRASVEADIRRVLDQLAERGLLA